MQDIYYINHLNQRINLMESPYWLQTGNFYDFEWDYTSDNDKITGFSRSIAEKTLTLTVMASTKAEFYTALNNLHAYTEVDLLDQEHGKLYIGDQYLKCYIKKSKKTDWEPDEAYTEVEITVVTDYPYWVTENSYSFDVQTVVSTDNKKYAYKYPYRYANGLTSGTITNNHFAPSDFIATIYGPATNPAIVIGDNTYLINAILNTDEYMTLNTALGTIVKTQIDGTRVNMFDYRDKTADVFAKIEAGSNAVGWSGDFAFDINVLEERSEPKWIF